MAKWIFLFLVLSTIKSYGQQTVAPKQSISVDSLYKILESNSKKNIGKQFPAFSFKNEKGNIFSNDNLINKICFINFWFEYCAPCVAEFNNLNELYLKFKDNSDFVFTSFTYETPENVKLIRKKYHLIFPIISIASKECYRLNFQSGFPINMILDKENKVLYFKPGGFVEKEKVEQYFNETLIPMLKGYLAHPTN